MFKNLFEFIVNFNCVLIVEKIFNIYQKLVQEFNLHITVQQRGKYRNLNFPFYEILLHTFFKKV